MAKSTPKDVLEYAKHLLDDGLQRRRPLESQWWENIAAYNGDFWVEYDMVERKLVEPVKPDHRVRLPVNLVKAQVRTEYAKILKNRPIVDVLAKSDEREDLNSAEVGDKILGNYIEKDLHMPKARRRALQWVLLTGAGGIFVDYDPTALGDIEVQLGPDNQPIFDEQAIAAAQEFWREKKQAPKTKSLPQGELRTVGISPFQYIYDFSKTDFEDAWWCIVSEVFDTCEAYNRWGVELEPDKKATPGVIERRMLERWDLSGTLQPPNATDEYTKLVEVHRLFVRPGHRYFPDGAEIVFSGDTLVKKTVFPFKHGWLPLGVMGHVPFPVSQYGVSVVQDAKPIALEISKTISQLIENRNMMANPPWLEFTQNRIQGEIQNKPGLRLQVEWMPNVPEPHPIEMPDMPAYVRELIPSMKDMLLEVTGQSEVSQGKVPAGARAGVTIAYLQEEDDTKIGPTVQEYEEMIERVSWLQLQTIAEKYVLPRVIRIYKKGGEPEVLDFMGTMLTGIAGVHVQAGSALPRSKAAKQQYVLDLWDRQIERDPRRVREMLELSEGDPDEFEKDLDHAERENRKLTQGEQVQVLEWHNHAAHHQVHRDFMKSAEWDDLDQQAQQVMIAHDEQHTNFERQQQMQQAAMASIGGTQPAPPTTGPQGGPPIDQTGQGGVTPPPEDGSTDGASQIAPQ